MLVCQDKICIRNDKLIIEFYKSNDVCLGQCLVSLIATVNDYCPICEKINKDHVYYYIKGEKLLKIHIFQVKPINDEDIFLSTNCRQCHKSSAAHYLSNAT